jgi:chemotaxis methyl-accepting protein methylase
MNAIAAESKACQYIAGLVYDRCRIRLHDGKDALIKARLGKRMRKHGFGGIAEYCDFLRTSGDEEEFTRVIDALTTNFTNFLREEEHFEVSGAAGSARCPAQGQKTIPYLERGQFFR